MDFFADFAPVLERLGKIGPKPLHPFQEMTGAREYLFETANYEMALQSDIEVLENDTLSFGYEARRFEAMNAGSYTEESTAQNSLFISGDEK